MSHFKLAEDARHTDCMKTDESSTMKQGQVMAFGKLKAFTSSRQYIASRKFTYCNAQQEGSSLEAFFQLSPLMHPLPSRRLLADCIGSGEHLDVRLDLLIFLYI